jgi:hypothetical protein
MLLDNFVISNACYFCLVLKKLNSVAVVRKRTIPTERPPLVGEVNFFLICIVGGGILGPLDTAAT